MDEVDKILNDYISIHNRKLDIPSVKCEYKTVFDNNFKIKKKTNYVLNTESEKINKRYFLYYIDCLKLIGYNFYNINQMIINTINDRSL